MIDENHEHTGVDSKRLDPKNFLGLPVFSAIPSVAKAPFMFVYVSGATKRLYVKYNNTLSYATLT